MVRSQMDFNLSFKNNENLQIKIQQLSEKFKTLLFEKLQVENRNCEVSSKIDRFHL